MQNPHLPGARLDFVPVELDDEFPLDIVLGGKRGDQAITQLHIHDALEIGFCLEGSGTFYVGPKIIPFHKGDLTVLTDQEFHRCRSSPGTTSLWAWFFFHPQRLLVPRATPTLVWEPERFSGPEFRNVLGGSAYPVLAGYVQSMVAEARKKDRFNRGNLRALILLLMNELHREFPRPRRRIERTVGAATLSRISPALEIMASRFQNPLGIPALARSCGMSVRNFQVQFGKLMGCSPQRHLLNSRIQAAAALLSDLDRPVSDIAFSCGFNTLSCFNRAFRSVYRMSPRAFRRQ